MKLMDYHALSIKQVSEELQTNIKIGLSQAEVERRFKKYGPNILPSKKRLARLMIFLNQFKSPLVYFLVIAAIVSFVLGEMIDGWVIMGAVGVAVIFGFFQEDKAEKSLQALKQITIKTALVLRDGREQDIDSVFLVPGDIILLKEGERIPADARIIDPFNLETDESSLTGESFPREKSSRSLDAGLSVPDRQNMVYMGTVVVRGRCRVLVTGIGLKTEIGKIAESLRDVEDDATPLQKRLAVFSTWLSLIILGMAGIIFVGGILRGLAPVEIFITSVAVAVASIPQGLIAAVSVILAIGMARLLDKKALVKKMLAAETLGSTTVICSDKTGTITEGKMTMSSILTVGDGKANELIMKISILCNASHILNPQENFKKWEITGGSTENALLESSIYAGFSDFYFKRLANFLDEIPFESRIRYRATLIKGDEEIMSASGPLRQSSSEASGSAKGGRVNDENLVFAIGAPETILKASQYVYKNDKEEKFLISQFKDFQDQYQKMAKNGLRVLAVAYKKVNKDIKLFKEIDKPISKMVFVGFIALKDPIRSNVVQAIKLTQDAGIRVALITGDNRNTAVAIAREIGLDVSSENVVVGKDLEKVSDDELKKIVTKVRVFARILPHDKLRIVGALQAKGEVVAMTGDGINDAPALKKADIGIAVGTATDVSKEASDMILLDSNFKTIVGAVRQGRIIFDNIKKVITYVLADSFSEVILIGGSLLLGLPLPLVPAQILWTNLVEDGLPTFALAFEPGEKDVMERKPIGHKAPLIDREMKFIIFIVGITTDIILFFLYFLLLKNGMDIWHIRTVIFAALGFNSLLYIFSIRSLRLSILKTGVLSNRYLVLSVLSGFVMLSLAIYFPPFQTFLKTTSLNLVDWIFIIGLGFLQIFLIEITKWWFISRKIK